MTNLQPYSINPAYGLLAALLAMLLWAPPATSQTKGLSVARVAASDAVRIKGIPSPARVAVNEDAPEIDVARDGAELQDEIRVRPTDVDIADTALIFTNTTAQQGGVRCIARGQDGAVVGRTYTTLPPNGLRYVRASDFSEGRDFVGHAMCVSKGRPVVTAVLFGEEITDLKTKTRRRGRYMIHRFPVIATY